MLSSANITSLMEPDLLSFARLERKCWPVGRFRDDSAISLNKIISSLTPPGQALRAFGRDGANSWMYMDPEAVKGSVRARVRNPSLMRQMKTQFCGPISVAFELARRDPSEYVSLCERLLASGQCTTVSGRVIQPEDELLARPIPPDIDPADWLFTASLRDDENWVVDVEDGTTWLEGLTTPGEMKGWSEDILGLRDADWDLTFSSGEIRSIENCETAVQSGGVAFLNIDSNLIKRGSGDLEEKVEFTRRTLSEDGSSPQPIRSRRMDDAAFMDLWVAYLGNLEMTRTDIAFDVWSWGSTYSIKGTQDSCSEYLFGTVIAWP
jgi:hypothetical protein